MVKTLSSSEAQGQIVGARESLNWRKNMARRKVKNGEKSPWDNVLPDQFQTVAAFLTSDWCQKTFVFFFGKLQTLSFVAVQTGPNASRVPVTVLWIYTKLSFAELCDKHLEDIVKKNQ